MLSSIPSYSQLVKVISYGVVGLVGAYFHHPSLLESLRFGFGFKLAFAFLLFSVLVWVVFYHLRYFLSLVSMAFS